MAAKAERRTAALLLLLLLSLAAGALADADFVARTCDGTADPDACRSVLGRDPRSANATTVLALAVIGLDAAAACARAAAAAMRDLLRSGDARYAAGTAETEALAQCAQAYGGAVEDLDEARAPLDSGPYAAASGLVAAAEDAGDACEDAFADRGVASVVGDVDRSTAEQCGVAADLIYLLDVPAVD